MKIEKGKFYRSRDGLKWEVLTTERNNKKFPIVAINDDGVVLSFSKSGYFTESEGWSEDLIAEWTEPVIIPWDDYPKWCKWVAMDISGNWYVHIEKPIVRDAYWDSEGIFHYIPNEYHPQNFTGHWTESLFERP